MQRRHHQSATLPRRSFFWRDEGWFPLDAADVRKVVLEQKLALDSPEVIALRERLFGAWK